MIQPVARILGKLKNESPSNVDATLVSSFLAANGIEVKKNQLLRMLRVDKITLALLEESLNIYLKNELDKIPTLKMLNTKLEVLEQRANSLKNSIDNFIKCEVIKSSTMVGGGTTPNKKIPTFALSLEYKNLKANEIEKILRKNLIISRIENDKVLLDFRTILEKDIANIEEILKKEFKNV